MVQNVIQAKPTVDPSLTQAVIKPVQADLDRQRAFVERQHIERQLNAAMAQTYAQNKRHRQIASMVRFSQGRYTDQRFNVYQPVSSASNSAYAMLSRSNPDLHQMSDQHVRSAAYNYNEEEEEEEEEEGSDSKDDGSEETEETEEEKEVRPRKQGKKASGVSIHKKKKKGVTESQGKGKEKEKKVAKKIKLAPRSASMPPKKRTARKETPSTSEDDADSTELTPEETEVEEEALRRTRKHKKLFPVSSSRFKAKVEREREALREKRPRFYYDHLPEGYQDDEDTPRKSTQLPDTRRQWSPRHSYHQWDAIAELRQRSPSPPSHTRTSRRIFPPRVSLLKDAQRRTIRLRDDEDEFDDRGRERQQEMDRRKHDARYRSQERFYNKENAEHERRHPIHYPSSSYRKDGGSIYYGSHDHRHQEEREHHSLPRAKGGQNVTISMSGHPQPPTMTLARHRDTVEMQENILSKRGSDEREHNKMFNLGRQEVSTRYPVRDEAHATSYRSRPTSPEHTFAHLQMQSSVPLMSPYHSQPSSPTKQPSKNRGNEELIMKISAMDVKDRGKNRSKEGEWPADLPRLPRTPGEAQNAAGDYFSGPHHQDDYGSGASTECARISGRTSGGNEYDSSHGSSLRSGRRDIRSRPHYDNLNMDLDDPPPRSVSPALSQESTSYGYSEQPQSSINHGISSKTYASVPTNRSMHRQEPSQQPLPTIRSHPQSQICTLQMTTPAAPEPPRPQSINPYVREQMNRTKINNGTPKVQTIDIESPAPVGGREKRADLGMMMSDPEDENFRTPIPAIDGNDGFSNQRGDTLSRGLDFKVNSPTCQVHEQNGRQVHSPKVDSPRGSSMTQINSSRGPTIQIDSPLGVPSIQLDSSQGPVIQVNTPQVSVIDENSFCQDATGTPNVQVFEVPGIGISRSTSDDKRTDQRPTFSHPHQQLARPRPTGTRGSLICGGCDGPIIGRIVSAMGSRWHPQCFKCTVCGQLLEHVSSYEHDGKPYCHLDYHEV